MANGNGVVFAKKVGIVAGACLAVIALGNAIASIATSTIVVPAVRQALAEERDERQRAIAAERFDRARVDSTQAVAMSRLSRDRFVILELMLADGGERARLGRIVRRRWAEEGGLQ